MNLLVLMYHRASAGPHGNSAEMLDAHFGHITSTYPTVLPGEAITPGVLNVCLTFDDGYYDFYEKVFPLLQKHRLRALLAIPPAVVCSTINASTPDRLGLSNEEAFAHPSRGGFCTWTELKEMAMSGHVQMAAHGYTHRSLAARGADLATEVHVPKTLLTSRLGQPIDSFLFPYGKFSRQALTEARKSYRYTFRIGGAINRNWNRSILYRVSADAMSGPADLFSPRRLFKYHARAIWNRVRLR